MTEENPRLVLHLTGPFRAALDGAPLGGLSRRGQGLLAWLACQPGMRAERAALADLLWSDRGEAQARASLRQEMSVLRKALGDVLEADRHCAWLAAGVVAVRRDPQAEFLQGFDLPSEGFEDWLRLMRNAEPTDAPSQPVRTVHPGHTGQRAGPALAVLAFEEIGVAEHDMFADGVVEEVTGALSRVRDFDVIARQSAFALRGQALSVPEIAARLGADYLVEGSVRRAGDRVRIAVQLVRGSDGHTVWSARFDDRLDDLFDLQDRIAAQVAGQVSPSLRAAEIDRAALRAPEDRTAYDLLLTACPQFWSLRQEGNRRAAALLDDALDRDPDYAHAMALRAWVHAHETTYMWAADPVSERRRALDLAFRAMERAGAHAPTLTAVAGAYSQAGDDHALAQICIDRVLAMDPNNAWAWIRQGWLRQYLGDVTGSLAAFDRAERLSPLDPFLHQITFGRAAAHYRWSDDPSAGLALVEEGLRRHPGVVWPLRMVAAANVRLGRMDRAREAAARLLAELPHVTIAYLRACLPPIAIHFNDSYFDDLARAGIPN